ncbi:MAG: hypothetical protein KAJ29_00500 [Alphaproteobacteria bacterium]|nr:hypothetical protein [Alphaproteobacteria bacterium]
MIHVIGNIAICINTQLDGPLVPGKNNNTATSPALDLTGHGALQAISAARCGAKVSLIGQIGTDLLGKYVLDILRKEGVQTSALSKDAHQSELAISLNAPDETTQVINPKNNTGLHIDAVPAGYFNARNLVVLSSDLTADIIITDWLEQIKSNGARIMLCLQKDQQDLTRFSDIIICDETTAPPALRDNAYIITTKDFGTKGAQAQKGGSITCSLDEQGDHGSETSFDIFCGYFAACLQASLPLERSLKIACNAAALSAQLSGTYSAIPYLGYLEDIVKEPAEKIKSQSD